MDITDNERVTYIVASFLWLRGSMVGKSVGYYSLGGVRVRRVRRLMDLVG